MRQVLLMLNPFIPFITEELWHAGGYAKEHSFIQYEYCEKASDLMFLFEPLKLEEKSLLEAEQRRDFVNACRLLLSQNKHIPSKSVKIIVKLRDGSSKKLFSESLSKVLNINAMEFSDRELSLPATISDIGIIYIDTNDVSIASLQARRDKILRKIGELNKLIAINEGKLTSADFTKKAPKNVIDGARRLLKNNMEKRGALEKILASL
jgi:valyl-tRNA synthetase